MTMHDDLARLWTVLPEEARPEDVSYDDEVGWCIGEGIARYGLGDDNASHLLCGAAEGWLCEQHPNGKVEVDIRIIWHENDKPEYLVFIEWNREESRSQRCTEWFDSQPAALAAAVEAVKEWRAE